jgi:hypothetical protein
VEVHIQVQRRAKALHQRDRAGVGIRGGKLDSVVTLRDSQVRDPLLGTIRRLNGNSYYWNVDFRHNVPGTSLSWGLFTEYAAKDFAYRLNSVQSCYQSRPFSAVLLEHKDMWDLKTRATVGNLLNGRDRSYTTLHDHWRNDSSVFYTRNYELEFGRIYRLQISGTF